MPMSNAGRRTVRYRPLSLAVTTGGAMRRSRVPFAAVALVAVARVLGRYLVDRQDIRLTRVCFFAAGKTAAPYGYKGLVSVP